MNQAPEDIYDGLLDEADQIMPIFGAIVEKARGKSKATK
jgi:hypothetical protein